MESPAEIIRRADALYSERAGTSDVRASLELLRQAAPDDFEAAWRTARAHFFLGQEAADSVAARAEHQPGALAGARAVRLGPGRVEGHFWRGVNLALLAQTEKALRALIYARRARGALVRAVNIDATFHAAGPLRVLARLEHKLPRLLGGGAARARARFELAIMLAPANTVTRIYYAELLLEAGEKERARAQLEAVLNMPPDPVWAFEAARDRRMANEMLAAMDDVG